MFKKLLSGVISLCFLLSISIAASYAADAKNEKGLQKAYDTYVQAVIAADEDTLNSMMADTMLVAEALGITGHILTKEQRIAEIKDFHEDAVKHEIRQGVSDLFIADTTGVVYGIRAILAPMKFGLETKMHNERYVLTFSYEDGKWLLLSEALDLVSLHNAKPLIQSR